MKYSICYATMQKVCCDNRNSMAFKFELGDKSTHVLSFGTMVSVGVDESWMRQNAKELIRLGEYATQLLQDEETITRGE